MRLSIACVKLAQDQPQSIAEHAAVSLLGHFLYAFQGSGFGKADAEQLGTLRTTARLVTAISKQLQQSRLFQQLPNLLTAAAKQLAALDPQPALQQATGTTTSRSSGAAGAHQRQVLKYAYSLCHLIFRTYADNKYQQTGLGRSQQEVIGNAADVAQAAMCLLLAVMQHVSAQVQHCAAPMESAVWAGQDPGSIEACMRDAVFGAVLAAATMIDCVRSAGSQSIKCRARWTGLADQVSAVEQLLLSQQVLPSVALLCSVAALMLRGSELANSAGLSAASEPATGSTSTTGGSSGTADRSTSTPGVNRQQRRSNPTWGAHLRCSAQSSTSQAFRATGLDQPQPTPLSPSARQPNVQTLATLLQSLGSSQLSHQSAQAVTQQVRTDMQHGISHATQWQQACSWLNLVTPRSAELFQLLKVDSRVMLWAAALAGGDRMSRAQMLAKPWLVKLVALYAGVLTLWNVRLSSQQNQMGIVPEQQQQHGFHVDAQAAQPAGVNQTPLLLSMLLLHTAAHTASTNEHYHAVSRCAMEATRHATMHTVKAAGSLQQAQEQDCVGGSKEETAICSGVGQHCLSDSLRLWEVLPLVLQVCSKLLGGLQHACYTLQGQSAPASQAPAEPCSSSSSKNPPESRTPQHNLPAATQQCQEFGAALGACISLLGFLCLVCRWVISAARRCTPDMLEVFEGVARTVADAAANPCTAGSIDPHQALMFLNNMGLVTAMGIARLVDEPPAPPMLAGPGSREHQQVFSLLLSLMKLSCVMSADLHHMPLIALHLADVSLLRQLPC